MHIKINRNKANGRATDARCQRQTAEAAGGAAEGTAGGAAVCGRTEDVSGAPAWTGRPLPALLFMARSDMNDT